MAPEAFESEGRITPAFDVWALAVVFLEVLDLLPPWPHDGAQNGLPQAAHTTWFSLIRQTAFEKTPPLTRMLEIDPSKRLPAKRCLRELFKTDRQLRDVPKRSTSGPLARAATAPQMSHAGPNEQNDRPNITSQPAHSAFAEGRRTQRDDPLTAMNTTPLFGQVDVQRSPTHESPKGTVASATLPGLDETLAGSGSGSSKANKDRNFGTTRIGSAGRSIRRLSQARDSVDGRSQADPYDSLHLSMKDELAFLESRARPAFDREPGRSAGYSRGFVPNGIVEEIHARRAQIDGARRRSPPKSPPRPEPLEEEPPRRRRQRSEQAKIARLSAPNIKKATASLRAPDTSMDAWATEAFDSLHSGLGMADPNRPLDEEVARPEQRSRRRRDGTSRSRRRSQEAIDETMPDSDRVSADVLEARRRAIGRDLDPRQTSQARHRLAGTGRRNERRHDHRHPRQPLDSPKCPRGCCFF